MIGASQRRGHGQVRHCRAFSPTAIDNWSPGPLMFIARWTIGISGGMRRRNGGAATQERTLDPEEFAKRCFARTRRFPTTLWSQRDT